MTNPIFPVKIYGNSSIILRMRTTSAMTTNPPPERNLASFEDSFPLLLSLMVSDRFSEVFSQHKSDEIKSLFYSYHCKECVGAGA